MMKRILLFLMVCICSITAKAQFSNTDTLRAFINRWIRNSAVESFQNLRLNTALIGMTNFLDSAYGGQVKDFTAVNDSTARLITIANDTFSILIRGNGISGLRRRGGTDSVEYYRNGSWQFAYKDSTGSSSADSTIFSTNYRRDTAIANVRAQKLNISDTTNKWLNNLRRRSGTDSVEAFKNGSWHFVYKDSTGGAGIDTTILTLTPGTSIAWDFDSGTFAQVNLSVNGTLSTPTNLFKGATGLLKVTHSVAGTTLTLPGLKETDLNYRSIKNSVTFTTDSSIVQGVDRYLKYIRIKPAHPLAALKIGTTNAGTEIQPAVAIDSAKWTTINVGEYYDQDSVLYFSGITSSTQIVYVTETDESNTNFPWSYNAGDVDYVAFVYDGSTLTWSKSNYGTNVAATTGTSYEAESLAFFAVNTGLSTTEKDAVNNLVIAAKGIGWSKFAAIWPAVGGTSTKNGYNLVDPTKFNITFNGGWAHSSTGSLADGTTGYADVFTNMDQMRVDGYFGVNDFHFSYYNRTSFSPSTDCILFDNGGASIIQWDNYASNHYVSPFSTSAIDVARTGITGLCLVSRRANNDAEAYRAGTSIGTKTNTQSLTFTSAGMRLNRMYGSATFYSPTEFAGGSCGKGLTSSEVTTWTNAWNAYQTALGR